VSDEKQLVTIGVLARVSGLTPSALRFYDDCGLLAPAEVDPGTGYRYYDVAALESRAQQAADTARAIKAELDTDSRILLPGPALAEAIDQVGSATATGADPRVLTGILLEAGPDALVLTATDRYRLTTRSGTAAPLRRGVVAGSRRSRSRGNSAPTGRKYPGRSCPR